MMRRSKPGGRNSRPAAGGGVAAAPALLRRQPDAALVGVHHRRGAERGELDRVGEVEDHLRLLRRQLLPQFGGSISGVRVAEDGGSGSA